ncbi:MAG: hypothetical protein GW815_00930 [Candidatus Moranbacteria bacterium]|nr:hypothetical protein [Candidatus Moranbacteria bacterium]OIQ03165.1 MAG: hypothetical protein AUK58_01955 [Candidatus Moranbacteria bacterium CG2_30_41_165]PIP25742.1 MAG: hypothetical protein COX32_01800 [Candidatus Moranbacteria bacterium CG23_combo_of_CG06-09_8_20_14_all_41_28]PIV86464.1 MAG: hypothetical protein COW50_01265 [Candidatus Moranbacteria bacterium CG17_big_fil_post_rev_8_21_14_2_50_41_107]PIW93972.1 MAG: hypothetical protein COZ86_03510 [Candidatus Moranbacteria bacterium CG_
MLKYPDDGKLHPTLSDWFREVIKAVADGWMSISIWIFLVTLIFWYPDFQTIVGIGLILIGMSFIPRLLSRK